MASKSNKTPSPAVSAAKAPAAPKAAPAKISAEAALSFLKDTKGIVSWNVRDLTDILRIGNADAQQVLVLLEAQGYIAREGKSEWITTAAGESVAGAKAPRFSRESVEAALKELKARIADQNKDRDAAYRIIGAVAFGDFLVKDRAKVQAADAGIHLEARGSSDHSRSATDAKREREFLKQLRGKAQMLNLRPYSEWMRHRRHISLL
jgi:hypothetical protein